MIKKLIFAFLFLFSLVELNGQTDPFDELSKDPEVKPALTYLQKGNLDSCLLLLEKFDSTKSNYKQILMVKSQLYWETKDFIKLEKSLKVVLGFTSSGDPNYSNLLNLYGLSLKYTDRKNEALEVFLKGYKETASLTHLTNLVSLYNDLEQYDEAVKYEPKLKTDSSGILYSFIGEAFYRKKNFKKAKQYLLKSQELKKDGSNFESSFLLGKIEEQEKNLAKACDYYNKAKKTFDRLPQRAKEVKRNKQFESELNLGLNSCK
jgi:hypothetical protein